MNGSWWALRSWWRQPLGKQNGLRRKKLTFLNNWGLGFAGDLGLGLAFAEHFTFWSFFLFFKLLTCCGIGSFFDYGLVWGWMSWVLCWVSILWMVWFGSSFIDVVVDDLIRWWCFASCWVSILLLGLNLYVLWFGGGDLGFFFSVGFFVFVCQENLWVWRLRFALLGIWVWGLVRIWV